MTISSHLHKRIKKIGSKSYIFDQIRKKYVYYSPEEQVRQYITHHLITNLGYSPTTITLEEVVSYGSLHKRVDVLIRNKQQKKPLMLIECKATHHKIEQSHLDQIAIYNSTLYAPFILITNGTQHICFKLDLQKKHYTLLKKIPFYHEAISPDVL